MSSQPRSRPLSPPMTARAATRGVVAAAIVSALAGSIHLLLTPEHFEEGVLFGGAFVTMGLYQVALAGLLLTRPGPLAYRAGIWGAGLIVATYLFTRVLPAPTATSPEPVTALGVAATTLELATLILLVAALPEGRGPAIAVPAWLGGLLVAVATPPTWLFVSGSLQWTEPSPWPTPSLSWFTAGPVGQMSPALYGWLTDRLYLFLPWWVALGALVLGLLAGGNAWLASQLRREQRISCRRQRLSLLGLLPATFAATVCCGVPLAAIFGLSTATLFAGAPFATAVSIGLLAGNLALLARRRSAALGVDC